MNGPRAMMSAAIACAIAAGALVTVLGAFAFLGRPVPAWSPAQDVRSLRCTWNYQTHTVRMVADLVNSRDADQDYALRVEYLTKAGRRVGSGTVILAGLESGQSATVEGFGEFVPGTVPDRCVIGLD